MQKIKTYLGEILTAIGVAISSYNIFNFQNHGGSANLPGFEGYYYPSNILLLIAIGFTLITIGVLVIKNKK